MPDQITLRVGDSYAIAAPIAPEPVRKMLTYWHKAFEYDEARHQQVVTGSTKALYSLREIVDQQTGQQVDALITFPGFAGMLRDKYRELGYEVTVVDERLARPPADLAAALVGMRDYQHECVYTALNSGGGIIACPCGWGKCTHSSTPIIYADGTVKTMGEVKVGDMLMGDDSTPRTVLERIDGSGPMYRLTPGYGDPIELADHHILSLVKSGDGKRDKYPDGHIVDITVTDYLKQSLTFKNRHKLYKVSVDFPVKAVTVDPYFMGMWLGNGTWSILEITTPFEEVGCYLSKYAESWGLTATEHATRDTEKCQRWYMCGTPGVTNPLMTAMRNYGLTLEKKKFIPRDFMINSREVRLQLLAGMLDSDGYYDPNGKFDWCSVDKELARDLVFLARSLGFRATENSGEVDGFGKTVTRYRVLLSGDLHLIPTKVAKKQATKRQGTRDVLRCGFKLERIADGPYVGVRLDGNMRHLLGDFTVTHNTHVIGAIIRGYNQELLKLRGTPMTLVVTPSLDISLKNYNDLVPMLPGREVGLVNTDHKTYSDDVQVITPESLGNIDITGVGLMIYDEVHTLTHSRMELLAGAVRAMRFGTSATPKGRFDNADLLIRGMFGPVIYSRTYEEAVQDGAVVPIRVYWVECPRPRNWPEGGYHTKPGSYRNGLWRNRDFNTLIASILMNAPQTMQALCVVDKLDHMDNIVGHLPGITYVHGTTSQKEMDAKRLKNIAAVAKKDRTKIYDGMASGETKRAISTGIYRQGINFKELAILVNAEGMGSEIIAGQLPGRTSRNIDGKDRAFIVDFHHPWDTITRKDGSKRRGMLLSDDRAREKVYTELKFEQVWVTDPSQLEFF